MNIYLSTYADFYSALLIIVVVAIVIRKKDFLTLRERTFFTLILLTFSLLIVEGVSFLVDGQSGPSNVILNYVTNYYLYLFTPILGALWAMYIDITMTTTSNHIRKVQYYLLFIIIGILPVLVNPFTNILFYIDQSNQFVRGDFYLVLATFFYGLFIYVLVLTIRNKNNVEPYVFWSILIFVVLPPLGGLLQVLFLGVASIHTMMALGQTIVYMSIETINASRDHLTKLFNRQKALDYLASNLRQKNPFTVLLIDMDNLKQINDEHGHAEGDHAIKSLTQGLKKHCSNKQIIARMGGDEFVVITSLMQLDQVEQNMLEVEQAINRNNKIPIHFSWGHYTMRNEVEMTIDDILMTIDERMYQQKAINKKERKSTTEKKV